VAGEDDAKRVVALEAWREEIDRAVAVLRGATDPLMDLDRARWLADRVSRALPRLSFREPADRRMATVLTTLFVRAAMHPDEDAAYGAFRARIHLMTDEYPWAHDGVHDGLLAAVLTSLTNADDATQQSVARTAAALFAAIGLIDAAAYAQPEARAKLEEGVDNIWRKVRRGLREHYGIERPKRPRQPPG
jgi:hypothetical protein